MAAYQTGTVTSTHTLIGAIVTFLTANGWSLEETNGNEFIDNDTGDDSQGRRTSYFTDPNGGNYYLTTGIEGATIDYRTYIAAGTIESHSDTAPAGLPYSYQDQAGFVTSAVANEVTGPYTAYHFFVGQEGLNGNYFYCVLELTSGVFSHFGIGELDRIGSTKAKFSVSLYWNHDPSYWRDVTSNRHQRMFDSNNSSNATASGGGVSFHQLTSPPTGEVYQFGLGGEAWGGSIGGQGQGANQGLNGAFFEDGPNAFNGRTMLMPNHVVVDDDTGWNRIIGIAPAFRSVAMDNLSPGDTVDTDWMVFPVKAKNAQTGPTSGNYGWAYKFQ